MTDEQMVAKSYSLPPSYIARVAVMSAQETAKSGGLQKVSDSEIVRRALELLFDLESGRIALPEGMTA